MSRLMLCLCLLVAAISTRAEAADEPSIVPVPEWVQQLDIPALKPAQAERPVQGLLNTLQEYFTATDTQVYTEWAAHIGNAQGLQAVGTIVIPWNPQRSDLLVHKVEIIRAGNVVDILANQKFAVLRRENNLESAMLDGVLTAVIQPEGLSVGDVVRVSYTTRVKPDPLGLKPGVLLTVLPGSSISRIYFREAWQADKPMKWRATAAMGKPKLVKTRFGTELVLDLIDVEGPKGPEGAPPRFAIPAILQVSEYESWKQISAQLAPVYDEAARLSPTSPLHEEIKRIAASTSDPHRRALAALRLVQDKIRYVALLMGDGGYLPTSADQTWSRKFGDCKGKTATLLALLKGLGIDAEPVLVNGGMGDSLADRLPMVELFNHVMARARIEGRDYWLDGTRAGDVGLASVPEAAVVGWVLAVRSAGSDLEQVPYSVPQLPLTESHVTYDASAGFFVPVPIKGEVIYRGDLAKVLIASLAQMGKAEFAKKIREYDRTIPDDEDAVIEAKPDTATGTLTVQFSTKDRMDWDDTGAGKVFRFQFDDSTIQWEPNFKRNGGSVADAPFRLEFPVHIASTETVILPAKGVGFALEGKNLEQTIAGTRITRTLSMAEGKAVARSTFTRLKPEISAVEARASESQLRLVNSDSAFVRAPVGFKISTPEKKVLFQTTPQDAWGFINRGYYKLQDGMLHGALADFDEAIKLEPNNALAHGDRAVVLVHMRKFEDAQKAIDRALAIDPAESTALEARGILRLAVGNPEDAASDFTQSLEKEDSPFVLLARADATLRSGKLAEASADIVKALELDPGNLAALMMKAAIERERKNWDQAIEALDNALKVKPSERRLLSMRADTLKLAGRVAESERDYDQILTQIEADLAKAPKPRPPVLHTAELLSDKIDVLAAKGDYTEALAVADRALAIQPDNIRMLTARCFVRMMAGSQLEKAAADCNQALLNEPGNTQALQTRGMLNLRRQLWDKAIADFEAVIRAIPEFPEAHYGRGLARIAKGDRDGGSSDLAAARRFDFDVQSLFDRVGLKP